MTQHTTNLVANGQTPETSSRGEIRVSAVGTWGSGTLTLEGEDPSSVWQSLATGITADGVISVRLPDREIVNTRTNLTGATSPDLDIWVIVDETH